MCYVYITVINLINYFFYQEEDLTLGTQINVYGRTVVLTDCDEFTKDFYRTKYGIEDFMPLNIPENRHIICTKNENDIILPPFNGWGTHEDSEGNCKTVEPKQPKIDFNKFITLDRFVYFFQIIKKKVNKLFFLSIC